MSGRDSTNHDTIIGSNNCLAQHVVLVLNHMSLATDAIRPHTAHLLCVDEEIKEVEC